MQILLYNSPLPLSFSLQFIFRCEKEFIRNNIVDKAQQYFSENQNTIYCSTNFFVNTLIHLDLGILHSKSFRIFILILDKIDCKTDSSCTKQKQN